VGAGYSYTDQSAWSSPFTGGNFQGPQISFGSGSVGSGGVTDTLKTAAICLGIAFALYLILKRK